MDKDVLLVQRKENVCTLVLNRPEKRNSLSQELIQQMCKALQDLTGDDSVRTVIIRGAGDKAFCSGYNIEAIPTKDNPAIQEDLTQQTPLDLFLSSIVDYPYPVIAMLNGATFGAGCELAMCCDIRVAAQGIQMGMPPAKMGLVYHWRGLERFIQTIGLRSTKEMFFTADAYEGPRLQEMGLVDYMVPPQDLELFTYGLAEKIASNAPLSLKGTKKVINLLMRDSRMSEENMREADSVAMQAFCSEDLVEGQRAFMEKRRPSFKGK